MREYCEHNKRSLCIFMAVEVDARQWWGTHTQSANRSRWTEILLNSQSNRVHFYSKESRRMELSAFATLHIFIIMGCIHYALLWGNWYSKYLIRSGSLCITPPAHTLFLLRSLVISIFMKLRAFNRRRRIKRRAQSPQDSYGVIRPLSPALSLSATSFGYEYVDRWQFNMRHHSFAWLWPDLLLLYEHHV